MLINVPCFTAAFLIEMVVKLASLRRDYFRDKANWLDGSLVILSVLDVVVLSSFTTSVDLQSLLILRMLRLVRLHEQKH